MIRGHRKQSMPATEQSCFPRQSFNIDRLHVMEHFETPLAAINPDYRYFTRTRVCAEVIQNDDAADTVVVAIPLTIDVNSLTSLRHK